MPKVSLQDQYLAALLKRGEREVERTHRHIKVTRTANGSATRFYFLGKAGSLRVGATKKGSVPVRDDFKRALIATLSSGVMSTTLAERNALP
jgi:hypothetical protein